MHRYLAFGSRHRGRGPGDAGRGAAAFCITISLVLAGCAGTPRQPTGRAASFSVPSDNEVDARRLFVDAATAMVGQPYRWGGSAPGGFDCSGLVAYAAAAAGIPVPRTTHEQIQSGSPTARSAVDTGDLVFMRLERKELHVGIAIDRTHFVHAPSSGRVVRIDSLDASPYSRTFITARRIVSAARTAAAPAQPGARAADGSGG